MNKKVIEYEELESLLNTDLIELFVSKDVPGKLNRSFKFIAFDKTYLIEWWKNLCYLYIDDVQIPFEQVKITGTWPNRYKNNLQFYYNGEVCAILPIEKYNDL